MNLDETSVCLFQGGGKGAVLCRKRLLESNREVAQPASSGRKRTCLTHIGMVCDRPDVQPLLPQVIIGNEATLKAGDLQAIQAACPGNAHLLWQTAMQEWYRYCVGLQGWYECRCFLLCCFDVCAGLPLRQRINNNWNC